MTLVNLMRRWVIALGLTGLVALPTPALAKFQFSGCAGKEDTIADAYALAFSRAKAAEDKVSANELYLTWFGAWTEARGKIVSDNLADIIAQTLVGTPAFTCYPAGDSACDEDGDGTDDYYAFIYAGESFEIHLCEPFWTVEQNLDIDKTDVLIHEVSHFHIGAQTSDHCYGASGIGSCIDLAISQPDLAVQNADSYMYFIKNAGSGL
ncbi:MAG: M35 family metallo-endopeptidase [Pseudomonadota bacterium]